MPRAFSAIVRHRGKEKRMNSARWYLLALLVLVTPAAPAQTDLWHQAEAEGSGDNTKQGASGESSLPAHARHVALSKDASRICQLSATCRAG